MAYRHHLKCRLGFRRASRFPPLWTSATHAIDGKCSRPFSPFCCYCSAGRLIRYSRKIAADPPDRRSAELVTKPFGFAGLHLYSATAVSRLNYRIANSGLSLTVPEGMCSKCSARKGWFCCHRDIIATLSTGRAGFRMSLEATRADYASTNCRTYRTFSRSDRTAGAGAEACARLSRQLRRSDRAVRRRRSRPYRSECKALERSTSRAIE